MCPGMLAHGLNPGLESTKHLWSSVVRDKACGSESHAAPARLVLSIHQSTWLEPTVVQEKNY